MHLRLYLILSPGDYIIPFLTTPPSAHFYNNKSALAHSDFVESAINDLLILMAM